MRFEILGPMRVAVPEQVSVSAVRLRMLLAVLLWRANQPVSADELFEAVWNGKLPADPSGALRTLVLRLRRVLGPKAGARIATRAPGYLIEVAEIELDAMRFEALCRDIAVAARGGRWAQVSGPATEALSLWRGQPLADVPCQMLRDLWVPHLEQTRLQVVEWRIEADLRQARHEEVVPQLRDLVELHPLRERFRAQLMLALARTGRRAEALAAYRDARRVLVEELGVEPGPELRRIHEGILAGDIDLLAPPRNAGEPERKRVAAQVPRQLPAAVQHFTGRQTELDLLTRLLEQTARTAAGGTVVISAIDGMAGIGKSALAVHAAHRLAERFPDGQLFIDLHGYTRGYAPRDAAEALAVLLRSLGVSPQKVPQDLEERAALYRQQLAGTRTLVVLDNVLDEAQVRPLVPGSAGCLVLVTSRRRLKGLHDAHALSLDVLPLEDAITLLRAVAGPERAPAGDPALAEIADLCGRLPLALRIAAALLRHRPVWTLEHLAGKLRDQRQRSTILSDGERDLSALIDLSYRNLGTDQQKCFRQLGAAYGPDLDAYSAAALIATDPATATSLLEDLVDHNLLLADAPFRYRLHDLVRAHTRALSADHDPPEEHGPALDRLLDYYQHAAGCADARVTRFPRPTSSGPATGHVPALSTTDAAWAWLRTERPNLFAALHHATIHTRDARTVSLTAVLASLLTSDGPWTESIALHSTAITAARRLGDQPGQARALFHRGHVRALTGAYAEAIGDLEQSDRLECSAGDGLGRAHVLSQLGNVRTVTGDYPGATRDLRQALALYRDEGDQHGLTQVLLWLGDVRLLTGDLAAATRDYQQASRVFEDLGNRLGQAQALSRLGSAKMLTGDHVGAIADLQQALHLCRQLGSRLGQANVLSTLGDARRVTGDYPGAIRDLQEALQLCQDLGQRLGQANALARLGRVRSAIGDHPGAVRDLRQALELIRSSGIRGSEPWVLNHYAAVVVATGDYAHALTLYHDALRLARDARKPDDEAIALEGVGECLPHTGGADGGSTELKQALDIFRRLGMTTDAERVQNRLDDRTAS